MKRRDTTNKSLQYHNIEKICSLLNMKPAGKDRVLGELLQAKRLFK